MPHAVIHCIYSLAMSQVFEAAVEKCMEDVSDAANLPNFGMKHGKNQVEVGFC